MASWWWNPGRLNEKSRVLLKSRQGVLLIDVYKERQYIQICTGTGTFMEMIYKDNFFVNSDIDIY